MALDHALMRRAARTGHTVLRVYSWSTPTISLGRHQRAAEVITPALGLNAPLGLDVAHAAPLGPDVVHAAPLGLDVVRRPTGGRAVVHAREVTYSITAPIHPGSVTRTDYLQFNRLLLDALRRLGTDAELAPSPVSRAPRPHNSPCFNTATEGEIVIQGRKLAGSAQWRDDGAILQHGSILIDDDQPLLANGAHVPPATLRTALGRPPEHDEVAKALFAAVRALADPAATCLAPDDDLTDDALRLRDHYADPRWTWRR